MLQPFQHTASFHRPDTVTEPLYVISPVFNPIRFRSRWKLANYFQQYTSYSGAKLYLIEASYGQREKVYTEKIDDNITVIHVRTQHEIWIKENMINVAMQFLPEDWKYVAWIDADVTFARPDWVGETLQQLQHYKVIQMFSEAADLSPVYEQVKHFRSWMWCYKNGYTDIPGGDYYYGKQTKGGSIHWHPGFAWAARREALDELGGLIDWGILGSGDRHMAAAMIGRVETSVNQSMSGRYIDMLNEWQHRSETYIKRNVGYMEGLLLHYWHGKKADRGYKSRWQILIDNQYNPDTDIKRLTSGIFQLVVDPDLRQIRLRDEIMRYFRQRNEDSIDL